MVNSIIYHYSNTPLNMWTNLIINHYSNGTLPNPYYTILLNLYDIYPKNIKLA